MTLSFPTISVVIPARNAGATIAEQLAAVAASGVDQPLEVIVVDNGSTDDTRRRAERSTAPIASLRVVEAGPRQSPAHARNVGVAAAMGDHILMCDADDVVGPGWAGHLAEALGHHALVGGLLDRARLNPSFERLWRDRSPIIGVRQAHEHLSFAPTGNLGCRRELFERLGGFDETLQRGEDVDFSWRAAAAGAPVAVVRDALVYVRLPARRRDWLRRGLLDGKGSMALYRRHRSAGMTAPSLARPHLAVDLVRQMAIRDHAATCSSLYDLGVWAGRVAATIPALGRGG